MLVFVNQDIYNILYILKKGGTSPIDTSLHIYYFNILSMNSQQFFYEKKQKIIINMLAL